MNSNASCFEKPFTDSKSSNDKILLQNINSDYHKENPSKIQLQQASTSLLNQSNSKEYNKNVNLKPFSEHGKCLTLFAKTLSSLRYDSFWANQIYEYVN